VSSLRAVICTALLPATAGVCGGTGPILPERSADVMLDSFEGTTAAYEAKPRGDAVVRLSRRPGIARDGTTGLLVELQPAPDEGGRHTVTLSWRFPRPQDWSGGAGLSLWLQPHADPPPRITLVMSEAGGASYWLPALNLAPRRVGEWQLVEVPFSQLTWSWEGPQDANSRLDPDQVVALSLEIRAEQGRVCSLGLDAVGLYHPRPAYAGPILRLRAPGGDSSLYVRKPGEDYRLTAEVRQLATDQQAEVAVSGVDCWGQPVLDRVLKFGGTDGTPLSQEFTFANPGPGYVRVTAVATCGGRQVYRAEQGRACLVPADPRDTVRNEQSLFGIWVNSDRRIGQQWDRILVRCKAVSRLPDGRYQVEGCAPGVAMPSKWGWGDPVHIAVGK